MLKFLADCTKGFSVLTAIAEYVVIQPCDAFDPDVQVCFGNPLEEWVREYQQIVRFQCLDTAVWDIPDVQEDMAVVKGAKQGKMWSDHRRLEILATVMIADQDVKSQQSGGLMGIVFGNDAKLARQSVRKCHTGQCNLKAGVGQTVPCNRQYAISNRNLEGLGKSQGNEFVVYKVWGFGRVKFEYAVDRTGNRSRGAGRASFQASGGVDAVGGGHRGIFWI